MKLKGSGLSLKQLIETMADHNMFDNVPRQHYDLAQEEGSYYGEEEERPTESPFMGNHVVKTVRNLNKMQ